MIVGPDWKGETPPHIKQVFHPSTQFSVVLFRTQLFNAADMPNVVKIQADYKVQPLSAYLRQPPPPAPAAINYPKANAELAKPISSNFSILRFSMPRLVRRKQASAPGSPALASAPASSST